MPMDISSIPRTFWHALSVAVLIVTFGLVTIAYRSASVSIEIASTKIDLSRANLSQAIDETARLNEMLKRDKEELEKAYAALEKDRMELKNKVVKLEAALTNGRDPKVEELKKDLSEINLTTLPPPRIREIPAERFDDVKNRLNVAQQHIKGE